MLNKSIRCKKCNIDFFFEINKMLNLLLANPNLIVGKKDELEIIDY